MKKENFLKFVYKGIKVLTIIIIVGIVQSNINIGHKVNVENFVFNKSLGMNAMAEKKAEKKPVVTNTFSGDLTGYAADCPLCNGTLACKPSYKVYKNNVITYNDSKYGEVRIVASSKQLSCGSVIKFTANSISSKPIYAIVLDRGVTGRNIDLLLPTESAASKQVGRKKITYEVVRNGW